MHTPALVLAALAPGAAWLAHAALGLQVQVHSAWFWVWLLLAAPLLEEAVFRLLLQRGLHQRLLQPGSGAGRWRSEPGAGYLASGITALAFAAVHAPSHGWQAVWWLIPGLALGEIWRRGQTLWVCVALHAWFNVCLVAVSSPHISP